jgi:hypothetical protein
MYGFAAVFGFFLDGPVWIVRLIEILFLCGAGLVFWTLFRIKTLNTELKILWSIALLFGITISFPVFWWRHIYRTDELPAVENRMLKFM